jgi:hypothetical protein
MRKSRATSCAVVVIASTLSAATLAQAADSFRKLNDNEIRSKLSGMEITDDIHWAEQYMRDGTLKSFDMGSATTGMWRAQNGNLCIDNGTTDSECREVWISGNKV